MQFTAFYKEYKENHLFWLMFVLFFFIWLVTTVIFITFCRIYAIHGTEGTIGAYANFLVFDATIFAPIAAYFFYDNWKIQHNKALLSEEAKSVYYLLHKERVCFYELREFIIKRAKNTKDKIVSDDIYLNRNLETITDIFNKNRSKIGEFTILAEDQNFHVYVENYRTSFNELLNRKVQLDKESLCYGDIEDEILKTIEDIKSKNYDCITEIKSYIFMK